MQAKIKQIVKQKIRIILFKCMFYITKKYIKKIPPDLLTGSIFGGGYKKKLCVAQNLMR